MVLAVLSIFADGSKEKHVTRSCPVGVLLLILLQGCGGSVSTVDAALPTDSYGDAEDARADDTVALDTSSADCPRTQPAAGTPCPTPGQACHGYGGFDCPSTAYCTAEGWDTLPCVPFGADAAP
jgi:hypothetical protein